jgi:ABC-type multidrug transport system ATPase subunit
MADVEQICDRAAVIVGGKLVFLGKISELKRDKTKGGTRPLEQALREIYDKPAAKARPLAAAAAS